MHQKCVSGTAWHMGPISHLTVHMCDAYLCMYIHAYLYTLIFSYKLREQECISVLQLLNSQCVEQYLAHKKRSVNKG